MAVPRLQGCLRSITPLFAAKSKQPCFAQMLQNQLPQKINLRTLVLSLYSATIDIYIITDYHIQPCPKRRLEDKGDDTR
jgi:hypothetical protein